MINGLGENKTHEQGQISYYLKGIKILNPFSQFTLKINLRAYSSLLNFLLPLSYS